MANSNFLFLLAQCMLVGFTISHVTPYKNCENAKCPGPLRFYEDLSCTPIKNKTEDCCAVRYNCDIFLKKDPLKCYTENAEYNIGARLNDHAKLPCEKECICTLTKDNIAKFMCTYHTCPTNQKLPKRCFYKHSPQDCCPSSEPTCLVQPNDKHVCDIAGKLYYEGEIFRDDTDSKKLCTCNNTYKGENVPSSCVKMNRSMSNPEFEWPVDLRYHCAPIYKYNQDLRIAAYPIDKRCQIQEDRVIPNPQKSKLKIYDNGSKEEFQCKLGGLLLNIGDELSRPKTGPLKCVHCVCEVPPYLTCRALTPKPSNSTSETKEC